MTNTHGTQDLRTRAAAPDESLVFAMIELDRLERERLELDSERERARATAQRQTRDIRQLQTKLHEVRALGLARTRKRLARAEREWADLERRLAREANTAHAERLARLEGENAERRIALARLQREVVAEFHPLRSALAWLTPFAASVLVAGALMWSTLEPEPMVRASLSTEDAPLAAEMVPLDSPSIPLALAEPLAPSIPEPIAPAPAKPSAKPKKREPAKQAPIAKPKDRKDPIVLGPSDDPL